MLQLYFTVATCMSVNEYVTDQHRVVHNCGVDVIIMTFIIVGV